MPSMLATTKKLRACFCVISKHEAAARVCCPPGRSDFAMACPDIFHKIAAREAARPPTSFRKVRRYRINLGLYGSRWSKRYYTYRQAKRALRIARALGAEDPYYV